MNTIESAWTVKSRNWRILAEKGNFIFYIYGNCYLFIWFTLRATEKKIASLISWPTWLQNWQSWVIKIGAEFIIQDSLVLSERTLHEGHNHLFCKDKISSFRNWWIEVWMSFDTNRVIISKLSSEKEEQKQD